MQGIVATSNGQTTFATSGYTPTLINVYIAGVLLATSDYTATDGTNIVLGSSAAAYVQTGTVVIVEALASYAVVNAITVSGLTAQMTAWFQGLPTSLPASPGILWNNGGTLSLS